MNHLTRTRIEKAAADCGFDLTPYDEGGQIVLRSSAFPESVSVGIGAENGFVIAAELLHGPPRVLFEQRRIGLQHGQRFEFRRHFLVGPDAVFDHDGRIEPGHHEQRKRGFARLLDGCPKFEVHVITLTLEYVVEDRRDGMTVAREHGEHHLIGEVDVRRGFFLIMAQP